jgi:hypothetical protein
MRKNARVSASMRSKEELGIDVIRQHRVSLARARKITDLLLAEAERVIDGKEPGLLIEVLDKNGQKCDEKVRFPLLGEKETLTDLMGKLSQSMSRYISLDREAHNLDIKPELKDLTPEQLYGLLEIYEGQDS